ncbi:MAG: zinc-ribbon domain-containing protein [Pyrinomonadaceae bacterium]|nr:zinc-ribbon domain-containing protein [Pyrinomonadaceae bacterium]
MIIVCQDCTSRLQVDETKVPSRPFSVRCPKCNSNINSGSPSTAVAQSALALGESPATDNPRFEQPPLPAPLFELEATGKENKAVVPATEKLAELLSSLLSQQAMTDGSSPIRPSWNPRKALVCTPEDNREQVARGLAENGFQVFVAEDTSQAVERMRGNQLDVVVLDSRFDPVEQGSVFVTREVSILRPAQRRRLFFVLLSPTLRTMDAHAAFLNNVNATVNLNDLEELPQLLEHRVREYNELYKDFNSILGVPAL